MALAAVTCLLEHVKEVLILYKDRISGLEDELKQVHDDLYKLKAFLIDKAKQSDVFIELERQITEDLYEMQEAIDDCLSKAIQPKSSHMLLSSMMSHYRLAKAVKLIRHDILRPLLEKFDGLEDKEKLPDGSESVEDPQTDFSKVALIRQDRVVGFEDEEAIIIEYLVKDSDLLQVIPIIGMPGLGKTTLAWKIYQNDKIDFCFPVRIWVNVSQNFKIRDIFLEILRKFIPSNDMLNVDLHELEQAVRMCLEREKFLLVLDDIWTVKDWNEIKRVLPLSNGKSKVLLTSRDNIVGMESASPGKPHHLRFLTGEESWTLLRYEVFQELNACPPELEGIGESIALQCGGLPLAIVVIGGILFDHLTKGRAAKEWGSVSRSVSDALQNVRVQGGISDVIESSYNRVPYEMRDCFLYMGIFPEDYEVPVQMLLRLWIAEGFIESKNGRSLEESGEEILNDLIRRNLLKAEKSNHMGQVKTCRVHDMVRAFCITKSEERNLFTEIKTSDTGEFPDVQKARRLCSSSDPSTFLLKLQRASHTRSFMCISKDSIELHPKYNSAIPKFFPRLRTLEYMSINLRDFPTKITQLIHLRYLTLFIDALSYLPESISLLWNLQTLVVQTRLRSITMKANVWRMFQLRHFKSKTAIVLESKWDGEAGQSLQTLNRLSPESCTESVSKRAKNLKTLGISGNLANIFKTNFFENLHRLENLKLMNTFVYKSTSENMLPGRHSFPPNLKRLTLTNTFLEWKHMSTLAKIDTLEVLKLKDNAFVGSYWNTMNDSFPRLQFLLIVNTDLVIWEASNESLPMLDCLVLKNCENLDRIPVALAATLQKLDIERLCKSAVDSAKEIAEIKRARDHGTSNSTFPFTLSIGPVYLG